MVEVNKLELKRGRRLKLKMRTAGCHATAGFFYGDTTMRDALKAGSDLEPGEPLDLVINKTDIAPVDIWRYLYDKSDPPEKTGMIRRYAWRTTYEVFKDLETYFESLNRCYECGHVTKRTAGLARHEFESDGTCNKCGEKEAVSGYIDEYFSFSSWEKKDVSVGDFEPSRFVAFPVVGANEGHYVHVGWLVNRKYRESKLEEFYCLGLFKTFAGWDAACEIANRAAAALQEEITHETPID